MAGPRSLRWLCLRGQAVGASCSEERTEVTVHHAKEGTTRTRGGRGSEGTGIQSPASGRTFSKRSLLSSYEVSATVIGTPLGAADSTGFSRTPCVDLTTTWSMKVSLYSVLLFLYNRDRCPRVKPGKETDGSCRHQEARLSEALEGKFSGEICTHRIFRAQRPQAASV